MVSTHADTDRLAHSLLCSHGLPPHKVTSELLLPPDNARRVGDAISMRLHELFTSDDPDQVIEAK
jgi:hypothetical protein